MDGLECRCGCGGQAQWLITGFDYDPRAKNRMGCMYVEEPACTAAALYCAEASREMRFPFTRVPYSAGALPEHECSGMPANNLAKHSRSNSNGK